MKIEYLDVSRRRLEFREPQAWQPRVRNFWSIPTHATDCAGRDRRTGSAGVDRSKCHSSAWFRARVAGRRRNGRAILVGRRGVYRLTEQQSPRDRRDALHSVTLSSSAISSPFQTAVLGLLSADSRGVGIRTADITRSQAHVSPEQKPLSHRHLPLWKTVTHPGDAFLQKILHRVYFQGDSVASFYSTIGGLGN